MCFSTIGLNGELSWTGSGSRAVCRRSFSSFRQTLTDVSCISLGFCASHNALHFSRGHFWVILCSILPYTPQCVLLPCEHGWHRQHSNHITQEGTRSQTSRAQGSQSVTPRAEREAFVTGADSTERPVNNRKERDRAVYFCRLHPAVQEGLCLLIAFGFL